MKYLVLHVASFWCLFPLLTRPRYCLLDPPQRYYCFVSVTSLRFICLSIEETSLVNMGRNVIPNHWLQCIWCNFGPQAFWPLTLLGNLQELFQELFSSSFLNSLVGINNLFILFWILSEYFWLVEIFVGLDLFALMMYLILPERLSMK